MALNPIKVHPKVSQTGAAGYALWLRSAMPAAYVVAAARVPALAAFEKSLRAQGLGDDDTDVVDDLDISADDIPDFSAIDSAPISVDYSDVLSDTSIISPDADVTAPPADLSVVDADLSDVTAPTLPPIAAAAAPAAAASSSLAASLPAIAAVVTAAALVTTAVINHSTAAVNASTVAKTSAAAQLQYNQALAGAAPLLTGTVSGPNGSYIAAVQPVGQSDILSSTIGGIPLWLLAVGGVGAALMLSSRN